MTTEGAYRREPIDRVVQTTLSVGVACAVALLVAGLILSALGRGGLPNATVGLGAALRGLRRLRPDAFYSLGILVLVLTPFLRVIGSVVAFAVERDWRYVAVTATVLAIMVVTIAVSI
jgi:uncharacterized membrane protein